MSSSTKIDRKAKAVWELVNAQGVQQRFAHCDLGDANLVDARLRGVDLNHANLVGADLSRADLSATNLGHAKLQGACLERATLTETNLQGANLTGCRIYGVSAWNVNLEGASQTDLVITARGEPEITVDSIEVAQFIYLLLENKNLRQIIDTITSKVVLIIGRFKNERIQVLDALRDELRRRDYSPVVFDFTKPENRDLSETISTLAHMASFVIADLTDARSVPQELQKIIPNMPSLPVQPIILEGQKEYAMFKDFAGYLSVLPPYPYHSSRHLLESLEEHVVEPALTRAKDIQARRRAFERKLA